MSKAKAVLIGVTVFLAGFVVSNIAGGGNDQLPVPDVEYNSDGSVTRKYDSGMEIDIVPRGGDTPIRVNVTPPDSSENETEDNAPETEYSEEDLPETEYVEDETGEGNFEEDEYSNESGYVVEGHDGYVTYSLANSKWDGYAVNVDGELVEIQLVEYSDEMQVGEVRERLESDEFVPVSSKELRALVDAYTHADEYGSEESVPKDKNIFALGSPLGKYSNPYRGVENIHKVQNIVFSSGSVFAVVELDS